MTTNLKPDMYLLHQLPDNSESGEALKIADQNLGGIQAIRIVAEWESDTAEPIPIIRKIEELVYQEKLLSRPLSIVGVLDSLPGFGKTQLYVYNFWKKLPKI